MSKEQFCNWFEANAMILEEEFCNLNVHQFISFCLEEGMGEKFCEQHPVWHEWVNEKHIDSLGE